MRTSLELVEIQNLDREPGNETEQHFGYEAPSPVERQNYSPLICPWEILPCYSVLVIYTLKEGRLADSVGRVCDSSSRGGEFQSHTGRRVRSKKKFEEENVISTRFSNMFAPRLDTAFLLI